jgi:hypothetical protein
MAGVGRAQELLAREIRNARGGDEVAAQGRRARSASYSPYSPVGTDRRRTVRLRRTSSDERCAPRRLQTMADDIAETSTVESSGPSATRWKFPLTRLAAAGRRAATSLSRGGGATPAGSAHPGSRADPQAHARPGQVAHAAPRGPLRALRRLGEVVRSASPGGALGHAYRGCRAVGRQAPSAAA